MKIYGIPIIKSKAKAYEDLNKRNIIEAEVEQNVCPLNWLAEYYNKLPGTQVILDGGLMNYLLNKSHADEIKVGESDGKVQRFEFIWEATEEYPKTVVKITCYNGHGIKKNKAGIYDTSKSINDDFVIEYLEAADILEDSSKYAENAGDYTFRGVNKIRLTQEQPQNVNEKVLLSGDLDGEQGSESEM